MWVWDLGVGDLAVSELQAKWFASCELKLDQSVSFYLCVNQSANVSRISLHIVSSRNWDKVKTIR